MRDTNGSAHPTVKLTPVEGSSNITGLDYDHDTGTLHVQFKSGDTYQYSEVPPDAYHAMMKARSKGSYFHRNIRNAFKWKQLEDEKS